MNDTTTQAPGALLAFDIGDGPEWLVRETLHHGDHHHVREYNLRGWRVEDLQRLLRTSTYIYTAEDRNRVAHFGRKLFDAGRASWGWSWFDLIPLEEDEPVRLVHQRESQD